VSEAPDPFLRLRADGDTHTVAFLGLERIAACWWDAAANAFRAPLPGTPPERQAVRGLFAVYDAASATTRALDAPWVLVKAILDNRVLYPAQAGGWGRVARYTVGGVTRYAHLVGGPLSDADRAAIAACPPLDLAALPWIRP
jgi:hypothetical protein